MKSGLEDRNNFVKFGTPGELKDVSMKSGLEDRNNSGHTPRIPPLHAGSQ